MFQNKKILVLGAARSGTACCFKLVKLNNEVVLNDSKEESKLDGEKIKWYEKVWKIIKNRLILLKKINIKPI